MSVALVMRQRDWRVFSYSFCLLDETQDMLPEVFEKSILPAVSATGGSVWRIGVPKRFGVGAAALKQASEDYQKEYEANPNGEFRYFHWKSSTVTPPAELELLRKTMDVRTYTEMFDAEWQNAAGGIFYSFGSHNLINSYEIKRDRPILIGTDFNVGYMAWVLAQETDDGEGLIFFDETNNPSLATTEQTLNYLWCNMVVIPTNFGFMETHRAKPVTVIPAIQTIF